jgi:diketogulonate reductase-like aldo/keto reductase
MTELEIPKIGFGTWKIKRQDCVDAVESALKVGYRHIDTAQIYGNQKYVGQAIKNSNLPRSEIFVTTKIWNHNLGEKLFERSLDRSLKKLQTDYVDLLLIHYPVTKTRSAAWTRMEAAHKSGKARHIGVSNYTIKHLQELLDECEIKPYVNQVELHVFLQQPKLLKFCADNDILVEAYSPLAHGHGMDNQVLNEVAKKHSKTTAQIMIRWCLDKGLIPLPKSTNPDRIKQNFDVFDFTLDKEDMKKIESLEENLRTCWDPSNTP